MDMVRHTIEKVRRTIARYNMISPGDGVVVAVSGGPDSVCLLDMLHELGDELGIQLLVAHFDHGLRPGEDEDETRFVESLAMSFNLPFETKKAAQSLRQGTASLEERARNARYRFFDEVKKKYEARKIAVGHNLNDQAETVLMRLMRGSGPSGLSGIRPFRDDKIVRPLIELTRGEIESYLKQKRLAFVTDSSNLERRHLRNRIRMELLPQLKRYQPRIVEVLGQVAEIMRRDDEYLEERAAEWVEERVEIRDTGEVYIPLPSFVELPEALRNRVIRQALKITGGNLRKVSTRHLDAVNLLATGKRPQTLVKLPNGISARRSYDTLFFGASEEKQPQAFCCLIEGPGTFYLDALGCTVSLEEMEGAVSPESSMSPWTAFLDAERITYPLMIRNFRPGDRFVPLGMSGHKKLKDFFIDLKIPSEVRARIPILTERDMPIWVCGYRIDDRFKVSSKTKKVLKVTFDKCAVRV
jgi:tRNA(Ile)-lysidine synthase